MRKDITVTNNMLAPEVRTIGRIIRWIIPYFKASTFPKLNKMMVKFKGLGDKEMRFEQILIDRPVSPNTPDGKLRICVYRPLKQTKSAPGILWIHGGGYAMGVPEQDRSFIRRFVEGYGCTVVAPDYCLSVERPYPAALEDCYTALLWLKTHSEELNINTNQLMVGGDSAGGGLTAAVTIYARDKDEVKVAFQMPLYPMLDDRMITPSSQNNDAPLWNTKSNIAGWKLYLGDLYGAADVPAYAAPARLTDYTNLPPAVTYIGSIEPFRDEAVAYMEELKKAGVPAKYQVYDGCFHAFDLVARNTPQAQKATEFLMEQFDYAVKHYFAEQ